MPSSADRSRSVAGGFVLRRAGPVRVMRQRWLGSHLCDMECRHVYACSSDGLGHVAQTEQTWINRQVQCKNIITMTEGVKDESEIVRVHIQQTSMNICIYPYIQQNGERKSPNTSTTTRFVSGSVNAHAIEHLAVRASVWLGTRGLHDVWWVVLVPVNCTAVRQSDEFSSRRNTNVKPSIRGQNCASLSQQRRKS